MATRERLRAYQAAVRAIGDSWDTLTTVLPHQVVIFRALHGPPFIIEHRRCDLAGYAVHVDKGRRAL